MLLYSQGWEAGFQVADAGVRSFWWQDWDADAGAVLGGSMPEDADAGSLNVGTGRWSFRPVYTGGDVDRFRGHVVARSGTTIWWSIYANISWFFNKGNVGQITAIMGVGLVDIRGTLPDQWLMLAMRKVDTSHNWSFGVHLMNADSTYNSEIITGPNVSWGNTVGWKTFTVELNTSTLEVKLWYNGAQIGSTATLGGAVGDGPYVYPMCSVRSGTAGSAPATFLLDDLMANDDNGTFANTRPGTGASRLGQILYHPDSVGSDSGGDVDAWQKYKSDDTPGAIDKWKYWNSDNLDATNCGVGEPGYLKPDATSDRQAVGFAALVAGTVWGVRMQYAKGITGEYNNTPHNLLARSADADFNTFTPLFNDRDRGVGFDWFGWCSYQFAQTPDDTPADWSTANLNALQMGCVAASHLEAVTELYALVSGPGVITRPTKDSCPAFSIPFRRRDPVHLRM